MRRHSNSFKRDAEALAEAAIKEISQEAKGGVSLPSERSLKRNELIFAPSNLGDITTRELEMESATEVMIENTISKIVSLRIHDVGRPKPAISAVGGCENTTVAWTRIGGTFSQKSTKSKSAGRRKRPSSEVRTARAGTPMHIEFTPKTQQETSSEVPRTTSASSIFNGQEDDSKRLTPRITPRTLRNPEPFTATAGFHRPPRVS